MALESGVFIERKAKVIYTQIFANPPGLVCDKTVYCSPSACFLGRIWIPPIFQESFSRRPPPRGCTDPLASFYSGSWNDLLLTLREFRVGNRSTACRTA